MDSEPDHVDSESNKRRKLRKGTRSCWNCKHRKVKCEFSLPSDETCVACRRRNTTCVSQEFPEQLAFEESNNSDGQNNLADRLHRVESLLSQLVKKVAPDPSVVGIGDSGVLTPSPTVLSEVIAISSAQESPAMALEDGNVFCKLNTLSSSRDYSVDGRKFRDISQALCLAFPARQDVETLCKIPFDSTVYLYQIMTQPNIDITKDGKDIVEYIATPPSPDTHPVILARQMLVMALILQYFPPTSLTKFSENPRFIMRRLVDEAIKLVTTNEELQGTIDALECIVMESAYHSNHGNLRRAWLSIRRAMTIAQMMGIDRASPPHVKVLDTRWTPAYHYVWHSIVYLDRFISLMLGLPSAAVSTVPEYERQIPKGPFGTAWLVFSFTLLDLEIRHSEVAKRLLERRNGMEDYAATQEIDALLLDAARSVPDDFWSLPKFDAPDHNHSAFWRTLQGMNQVKHYSLVNCLHLPYLLREDAGDKYEYSKIACLMASREIIRRYNSYRTCRPILSCCRVLDFVALLAALSLMIAHLNVHRDRTPYYFLQHQRPGDRALVEQLSETMDQVANLNEDAMTYQSSCLMRRMMHIEADAFQGHCYLTEQVQPNDERNSSDQCDRDKCHVLNVDIPYFGVIRISRQNTPAVTGNQSASLSAVEKRNNPVAENASMVAPYLVATGNIDFSLRPYVETSEIEALQPLSYPDLTATVDDWAFQGVDTAFFGSLMGSGPGAGDVEDGNLGNWTHTAYPPRGTAAYAKVDANLF